jgi:hypothetical protein
LVSVNVSQYPSGVPSVPDVFIDLLVTLLERKGLHASSRSICASSMAA